MKLYQFIISIICLQVFSFKFYIFLVNILLMTEYYHKHKFISNKKYEKYFAKIKKVSSNTSDTILHLPILCYLYQLYNFLDKYWNFLKDDFNLMVYEKFVNSYIESNREERQKKFSNFLSGFSDTLKNIERQTDTNSQYFIPPINPFEDKTRIDDE